MNSYISAAIGMLCGLLGNIFVFFLTSRSDASLPTPHKAPNDKFAKQKAQTADKCKSIFLTGSNIWKSATTLCSILVLVILILLGTFGIKEEIELHRNYNLSRELIITACRNHYYDQNYGLAYDSLKDLSVDDPNLWLIKGYFLINGFGIDRDIESGIECYKTAMLCGSKNAEACLVVAVMKNYRDSSKIDIVKTAFEHGDAITVKYIDELGKSNPSYSSSNIWSLPEEELLTFLNQDMAQWVGSTRTYATAMSQSSTPTFTRRFLYPIGTSFVYEEMNMVGGEKFPLWFSEEELIWELS